MLSTTVAGDVVANLIVLVEELKDVTDWFNFGVHLGIPHEELMVIGKDYNMDTERCKLETLIVWGKRELCTWSKVIEALIRIEMFALAEKIAEKYGKWWSI